MLTQRTLTNTYRIPVIWGVVIVIALLGLAGGWIAGRGVAPPPEMQDLAVPTLVPGLEQEDRATDPDEPGVEERLALALQDPEALLNLALWIQANANDHNRLLALAAWPSHPETDPVLDAICRLLIAHHGSQPPTDLVSLAEQIPPPRWANRALGDFDAAYDRAQAALERYVRESQHHPEASSTRRQAVTLAFTIHDHERLGTWAADPDWADAFDPHSRLDLAAATGEWSTVLEWLLPMMYANVEISLAGIAIVAALVYLFFLWHASYALPRRIELGGWCLVAFALGIVSTWVTILAIVVEEQLGYGMGDTAFQQAVYAILGIGLREETAKLVCFLPLVPVLLRRHGPLAWLLVASCVGAGFAAQENVGYYQMTLGSAVGGRFLTANFLHLALTGMAGLALCQAIRWPRQMGSHAAGTFALVVIAHGLYDAFLMVDALSSFSWAYLIVFVLTGNAYFAALNQERSGPRPALSLTLVFCGGLTLVLAVAYVVLSAHHGSRPAALLLFPGLLTSVILVVMFVRGIGDQLSE